MQSIPMQICNNAENCNNFYIEKLFHILRSFLCVMVFCLENVFEEEPGMLTEIVRQVNDPRIRMCLDVGHVNAYSKISVMEWLESCVDLTEHFHIHNNDTRRDAHGQLMDGTIPMKELLAAIEEKCPNATLTLELMNAEPSVRWLLEEQL